MCVYPVVENRVDLTFLILRDNASFSAPNLGCLPRKTRRIPLQNQGDCAFFPFCDFLLVAAWKALKFRKTSVFANQLVNRPLFGSGLSDDSRT